MLKIEVEFLLGTYRADPTGDAITDWAVGEWPPAPARLLGALIAADGPSSRDSQELKALAAAPPPVIYADPDPHRQPLEGRYVVASTRAKATHQEYLARKGALVRPGERISPRDRSIVFLYREFHPDSDAVVALKRRAARVGYLGCADSPVAMTVESVSDAPARDDGFIPDPRGSVIVNTHTEGHVAVWCTAYEAWALRGIKRRRFPALRHQTAYRSPKALPDPVTDGGRVVSWIRFGDTVPGRRVAGVAHEFKRATYSRYTERNGHIPPAWFHGHGVSNPGGEWQVARVLPLPNVGHRHSNGRIHGIALWVPPEASEMEARLIREAAQAVTYLRGFTDRLMGVDHRDRRRSVYTTRPSRWNRPSHQWATAFPVVSDRHGPVRRLGAADVARWCRQAGLPEPIAARVSRIPLLPRGVDLSQPETARPGHTQTRPWAHIEMFFAEKIGGPVAIGAARSYGLGLCAPVATSLGKGGR